MASGVQSGFDLVITDGPLSLTVVILTHNERRHIRRAISSVGAIARDIVVLDSYSSDDTVEIAVRAGARVMENRFINQAKQFQWALDHADLTTEWVMRLDADEIIEPDLASELLRSLPGLGPRVVGINLVRKHIFMSRWIRHGGRYPLGLLRIWRNGHGRVEDRWMDEHIVVSGGSTITLKGGFADWNLHDLSFFTDKHNKYATREAIVKLDQKYHLFPDSAVSGMYLSSRSAAFKRFAKENVYNKLPFWMAPTAYFLYRYFLQFGFLDGYEGLIYHFLQGFWYRFLVEAKTIELDMAIADFQTNDERLEHLSLITGLNFSSN